MMRRNPDGRTADQLRTVTMTPGFHLLAEGSVLYACGGTKLLITASVDESVPGHLEGKKQGWITAEYQMHPRANPRRREPREGRDRPLGGRSQEIQRLVGRSLRAAVDLRLLGERTITIDCDVLEADGGTRTAAITGGWVALALAIARLRREHRLELAPLRTQVAAVSAGLIQDRLLLDLDYGEDSKADVDMNVVGTSEGDLVEIQGTAEGAPVPRSQMDGLIDLSLEGIATLCEWQRQALQQADIELHRVLRPAPVR